jgi:lipopolysaccharide export system permease protein
MKLIDKYVLREHLVPLGYCLAAFSLMYVVIDLFERLPRLIEGKVSILNGVYFYANYLFAVNGFVPFIVVALPVALLLSTLYTLVVFGRHNELTAMRASGVSLRRLLAPFVAVGLCATVVAGVAQELIGPGATRRVSDFRRLTRRSSVRPEAEVLNDFLYHAGVGRRHWLVQRLDLSRPHELVGVKVTLDRSDGSLARELRAERAEWLDGRWWFHALRTQRYDEGGAPVGGETPPSPHPVEMREFAETPEDFVTEILQTDSLSTWDMIRYLRMHPSLKGIYRARRKVDIHARMAMPFTCLVMVLLGLPAGASCGRRGALRGVVFAVVALFAFYVFVNAGLILGKRAVLWPWLAGWLPNLLFLAAGWALTRRLD